MTYGGNNDESGLGTQFSRPQTITPIYVPTFASDNTDFGVNDGSFVFGSFLGLQDGTSSYALFLIKCFSPVTLVEAPVTAHLFGSVGLDGGDNLALDIRCTFNDEFATCTGAQGAVQAGVTTILGTSSVFTESILPFAVTLVDTLPSTTSNPPVSPSSSPSPSPSNTPSPPSNTSPSPSSTSPPPSSSLQVTTGTISSTGSSQALTTFSLMPFTSTPGSSPSPTNATHNSARHHMESLILMFMCAFPLAGLLL
ncbi:hypothetical protein Clacol_005053 [Clathrus columnatus]|uniref:Uncharacterized protein n=1 Tax=Clathrus columnatus TaxID=1419009 RepID=A0AAV5AFV7_9AGAM|nr:hypothetical protein Clacol_005053 [Clathrus columnatus]